MVGDDQYEIFWYDIKLPELLEENDSARKKNNELYNVNQFTKDGWKLISVTPFIMKKMTKKFKYIDCIFKEVVKFLLKKLVKNIIIIYRQEIKKIKNKKLIIQILIKKIL